MSVEIPCKKMDKSYIFWFTNFVKSGIINVGRTRMDGSLLNVKNK